MTRTLPRLLAVIAIAVFSHTTVQGAAIKKVVHAATTATPIVIAVVSDHYTDQSEFDSDVANFITYGLLAHPYYAAHAADLQIESFYEALPATAESNYGFNVEVPSQNCVLSWTISNDDTNTATRIEQTVGGITPEHTIVIGDHPYNIGCTDGEWTYVAADAAGTDVLPHELGHGLASLYDEWFFDWNRGVSHPGIPVNQTRNCYDIRHGTTPPWNNYAGAGSVPGCDFYELNVVHAYRSMHNGHHYCLMGATHDAEFCPVCHRLMEEAFEYARNPYGDNGERVPAPPTNLRVVPGGRVPTPVNGSGPSGPRERAPKPPSPPADLRILSAGFMLQPPSPPKTPGNTSPTVPILKPTPTPIVRLVVSFDPSNGAIVAKKAFPITARYVPSYRRLGEYVYEIVDLNQPIEKRVIDVGVLPSNLFTSRSYQGGTPHQTSAQHATDVTIQLPVTRGMLTDSTSNVAIRIYRLSPDVTEKLITPAVLATLKANGRAQERGKGLSAPDLRDAM